MKTMMMLFAMLMSVAIFGQQWQCGMPVTLGNQTYQTVSIGNQCWFSQNLNVGTMIQGTQSQTNNGITEKYCYNNLPSMCDLYGGLYQWDEMMQYMQAEGSRGLCPEGWHIPTYADWMEMITLFGGIDLAGAKLNQVDGWKPVTASVSSLNYYYTKNPQALRTNESGLSLKPNGYYLPGRFGGLTVNSYTWSSTKVMDNYFVPTAKSAYGLCPVEFATLNTLAGVARHTNFVSAAYGVRCVKY